MSTSVIALVIAGFITITVILGLGMLSLLLGVFERYWGGARLTILRSQRGPHGFAFQFEWNQSKEPAKYYLLRIKLFNPFGRPSQVELAQSFSPQGESFAQDLDIGPGMASIGNAQKLDQARVEVELCSRDGVSFHQEFKAQQFLQLLEQAKVTVADITAKDGSDTSALKSFWTVGRDFIADTVPGKGAQIALPTNPAFAAFFQASGSGGGGEDSALAQENFAVNKVWIEDGCIVCNACEDIYPEVFKVIADGCEVIAGYPTDDGLKVEEAAEACPVEIIKFVKV